MSQFRQNPVTKEWVLIAPNRNTRPEEFSAHHLGHHAVSHQNLPELIKECPFCPGNEHLNPDIGRYPNGKQWEIRIIPNKYEALSHTPLSRNKEFYVSRSGSGDHEVLILRKHNEPVALQSIQTVELTFQVFKHRLEELKQHRHLAYVQFFHNHGRDAGASLLHPHYQLISTPMVPNGIHDELLGCYHYYQVHKECIFCAISREELKHRERLIFETSDFVVFAPYASRIPFETLIIPKEHISRFEHMTDHQITQLAYVLKVTLGQLYTKLNDPPLNFYIHTMPFEHVAHTAHESKAYHWHLTIFPRIGIWGGFEFGTGVPINTVSPELAAEFLK